MYIVFSKEVNPYAITVFQGFLILGGSVLGLTVVDKIPFAGREVVKEETKIETGEEE